MLTAQHAIGVFAFHLEHRAIKANALARHHIEHFEFPSLFLDVSRVHAIEHVGPVLRLEPALARVYRHDGVRGIEVVGEPGIDFELIEHGIEAREAHLNLGGEAFVFIGEFIGSARIVEQAARDVIRIERVAQIARLLRNLLRRSRVIPEARLRRLMVEIDELGLGVLDMQVFMRRSQTLGNIVDIQVFFLSHSSNHSEFKKQHFGSALQGERASPDTSNGPTMHRAEQK